MTTLRTLWCLVALVACASSKNNGNQDGGTGSDGTVMPLDAFGGSHFGEMCTTSADCAPAGYCVDGPNGKNCTYSCDAGCPDGWNCRVEDVGGQLVSLCMPQTFDFCKPCTGDAQCNGGKCIQLDGAGYCLPDCPFEGQCATGYTCENDPSGVHDQKFCVPDSGSCTCNADNAGQQRTCQTMNAAGTCYGLETCTPGTGWTGCTASTATTETCDGMDNDCDQLIDDGVSGSACQITNGNGTCPGVQLCTGNTVICQGPTPAPETCNYADDNCNGTADELWPTLSMPCNAGVGACARFGVLRCNTAGNGVECSVTAGPTSPETCNNLDDDCDTKTDETFTTLGQSCTVGTGACQRTGNQVCNVAGNGTQCSVTPSTGTGETCNLVDDDCDTKVDEDYKNASGIYNQNTACGSCAVDCTALYALPNASGVCNATSSTASCSLQCAPGAFNLDGAVSNGCELLLDPDAIYVSKTDGVDDTNCGLGPTGTGAGFHPCLTIGYGISRSVTVGRAKVRVANGIYPEAVTVVNGKSLLGGHAPDNWQRNVSGTSTQITGVATVPSTNHDYTVRADAITSTTVLEGFVVIGTVNAKTSGNSYGVYVTNSTSSLSIINNQIYGGRGGPGTNGSSGTAGTTGVNGTGRPSNGAGYDALITTGTAPCDPANNRSYNNGGQLSCGGDDVSGGKGGGNQCNPRPSYNNELSGIDGTTAQAGAPALGGAAGAGADAGDDGATLRSGGSDLCAVPTNPDYGRDGEAGKDANHGAAGAGCSAAAGSIVGGHWVGGAGSVGATGGNGGGGGGGGAGGGSKCAANGEFAGTQACQDGRDRLGGHGGGGGSGGCGGTGGSGASGGGGAFAIFIVGGASAPVVTGNSITRGTGGTGGSGGAGGAGGAGGIGAAGGTSAVFCAGAAGRGGNGGDGGNGAGGGGGCGGSSFGIVTSGLGSPNYCTAGALNSMASGSGGAGGAGGYSLINTGGSGAVGTLGTCQFN